MRVAILPDAEGIVRARSLGGPVSTDGVEGVVTDPEIGIVFEATSPPSRGRGV
jgi:acetaldehyde dehydrogenase (acetylating)